MSFFRREESRVMPGWQEWAAGGDAPGSQGSATGLVPFFASVRHIVDYLSTLPIDSFRKDGKSRVEAPTPALIRRLDEPGGQGADTWVGQWGYGLAVDGNAVGWTTAWDGYGYPTGIRWLARSDWGFEESTKQWYVFGRPVSSQLIVHCPWIVPNGKTLGISPLEHFMAFWRAGLSAQSYADVGRGGGIPPAHLKNTKKTLNATESEGIQSRAVRSFASGRPFVSGNDWDLNVTAIPPNQAQFLNTLQLTANQTAAIFGIDPREIGGTGASGSITYVNDESKSLDRANNMRPYLVRFENMTKRILPERQYIRLNADATVRTDIKTRTEIIGLKLSDGRMNVDEARTLDDMEPLPNGQGQRYNVPAPKAEPTQRKDAS